MQMNAITFTGASNRHQGISLVVTNKSLLSLYTQVRLLVSPCMIYTRTRGRRRDKASEGSNIVPVKRNTRHRIQFGPKQSTNEEDIYNHRRNAEVRGRACQRNRRKT